MARFLINYNKVDEAWAEWIAWVLNCTEHDAALCSWLTNCGVQFADVMSPALANIDSVLVVLSEQYLATEYTQPDWAAAFEDRLMQSSGYVIPVRVGSGQVKGVLETVPAVDLVDLEQETAREKLLWEVMARATLAPAFPMVERNTGKQPSTFPTTAAVFPPNALSRHDQANQDVVGDRNIIIGLADTGSNIVINHTCNYAAPELNDVGLDLVEDVGLVSRLLPSRRSKKIAIAASSLVAIGLVAMWLSLPIVSARYDHQGQQAQDDGDLNVAAQKYKRAISLNYQNADAHYNLATLYESREELEQAEVHYKKALGGGFPEAYNNLGRLYLMQPDPQLNKSVSLLQEGVKLADKQRSFPEIRYTLYKNLGWARFKQRKYAAAEPLLKTAISISEQPDVEFVVNPGSAHCLLAQVLEGQSQHQVAFSSWQRCCQEGDDTIPEESVWLQQARTRLNTEGLNFNQLCKPNAVPISSFLSWLAL